MSRNKNIKSFSDINFERRVTNTTIAGIVGLMFLGFHAFGTYQSKIKNIRYTEDLNMDGCSPDVVLIRRDGKKVPLYRIELEQRDGKKIVEYRDGNFFEIRESPIDYGKIEKRVNSDTNGFYYFFSRE